MWFLDSHEGFRDSATEFPDLYNYIQKYADIVRQKVAICQWMPQANEFSCDELCSLEEVT